MSNFNKNENEQPTTSRGALLQETQQQVDKLVEILHDNVDRALEREHRLTYLNEIGENLARDASNFRNMAAVLNRENSKKSEEEDKEKTPLISPTREHLLQQTQQQVDELVDILFVNVHRALERDHNLLVLNEIGENLERGAIDFRDMAAALKRNLWKKRVKHALTAFTALGAIGAIFIVIFTLT